MPPLHLPESINAEVVSSVLAEVARSAERLPLWCPWPLPPGWTVTGVGWAGDDRAGVRATMLAGTGPGLADGPADLIFIAEAPGVGLASRYAGLAQWDPGPALAAAMSGQPPHAKPKVSGHPTPLWSVPAETDRSAHVGEARGVWLMAVAWPPSTGYLLADDLELRDLGDWLPAELVFGARSARLSG